MSKKPAVEHEYNRKKDRFDIILERFSLRKKWLRSELIDSLMAALDQEINATKEKASREGSDQKYPN